MQKKYQFFVSSTFRDLVDERQDAIRSILDLGHIPAGMELFPASDTDQLEYIKKVIDECDYYILIMGGRYGSLDQEGVSFTEREYDYAVDSNKTVLAFVHGNALSLPVAKSDTAPKMVQSLNDFRQRVMSGPLVREWTSRENLEPMVVKAVVKAISDYPAVGWIRGDAAASETILSQVNDLRVENDTLKSEISKLRAEAKPALQGLAGLGESTSIRYTYTRYYGGTPSTENGHVELSWSEVLRAVGSNLSSPASAESIYLGLATFLKENRGKTQYNLRIMATDVAMVKGHLIGLGYVRAFTAKAVNGGLSEFIQLTDRGQAKLLELLAVRSSTSSSK
ncbi:MAG TPA: DUF4062 domain-containing protein [Allosphingosinicella sp.]|nr:DUF4062 domain-containing protein [Allosphingosinicella sp.]